MKMFKERGVLVFRHSDRGVAKYDLKTQEMIRVRNGVEKKAKSLAHFFCGYNIEDVFQGVEDVEFMSFMKYIRSKESTCNSVGSFISRMSRYMNAESFYKLGINLHREVSLGKVDIKTIPRDVIKILAKICKNANFKLEENFFRIIRGEGRDLYLNMIRYMDSKYEEANVRSLLKYSSWSFDSVIGFIDEYKYEYKSYVDYIVYIREIEGIGFSSCLGYLRDYYFQSLAMSRNKKSVAKYPKFLRSRHDITSTHYSLFKEEYSEEVFSSRYYETNFEYSKDKEYVVLNPKDTVDLKEEGQYLSHCVKSYINRIIDGSTIVVFIRHRDDKEERLLTMEICKGKIVQVKGLLNRSPSKKEMGFVERYAKVKNFSVSKYIGGN